MAATPGRSTTSSSGTSTPRPRLVQILGTVGVALVIVVAAWWVGGRAGWDELGHGGVNRSYLPKVGEQVPELGFMDQTGSIRLLSEFQGNPIWINFWGSWCDPCKVEFPAVQAAYEELAPEGLILLAISVNETWETAATFADRNGGTFPIYNIPSMSLVPQVWDTRNFPTHLYIDEVGIVRYVSTIVMDNETAIERGQWLLDLDPSDPVTAFTVPRDTPLTRGLRIPGRL